MWWLYDAGIRLFLIALRAFSLFNAKAKQLFDGRADDCTRFTTPSTSKPVICLHCASMGEFEMIRPLLTAQLRESYFVIVTFFSPSGYNHAKCEGLVDQKYYLPFDTKREVKGFLDSIKPSVFVFVKYDFWFRMIQALHQRKVKVVLVNGLFRPKQFLISSFGSFFRKQIAPFEALFVQNDNSAILLNDVGIKGAIVTGDLRYDRVISICESVTPIARIVDFRQDKPLLILGSSWLAEEQLLKQIYPQIKGKCKVVIAPHDVSQSHVEQIQTRFHGHKVNMWLEEPKADADILIINTIGVLSSAYQHANIAFIGGAFGSGLHNILEAATFGMPIICGPKTEKYPESDLFEHAKVLHKIAEATELLDVLNSYLDNASKRNEVAQKCRLLVQQQSGAARMIEPYFQRFLAK